MKEVTLVEVGLRDGLQNEQQSISIDERLHAALGLIAAGVKRLEAGAFVRPERIPQMTGSLEVLTKLRHLQKSGEISSTLSISALVPNEKGMIEAVKADIKEIAIFSAASETFSKKNTNCSIEESFTRFIPVIKIAKQNKIKIRGYISTCFGCPYEGEVDEKKVLDLAVRLHKLGCYEISIGDTIGVATPNNIISLFRKLKPRVPLRKLAGHFHDTRGTALANIYAAYNLGLRIFDTSLGGLGGCPYAPGAAGNVATEDVVFMFNGMGIKTGLNLQKLIELNKWMSLKLGRTLPSKMAQAGIPVTKK